MLLNKNHTRTIKNCMFIFLNIKNLEHKEVSEFREQKTKKNMRRQNIFAVAEKRIHLCKFNIFSLESVYILMWI